MRALSLLPFLLVAVPLSAQSEDQLRGAFEGRSVVVKIDMPATARGVDIQPMDRRPLDVSRYADRLKDFGTALKAGTTVMVTKVKVKKDLIEFQLGGGGYGTFGDEGDDVQVSTTAKSAREKSLEKGLKNEKDPANRKAMQEELDRLRRHRDEQDALVRATAAAAAVANKERIREKALAAGSRFNVRFDGGVPLDALTPDGLSRALAEYVDFTGGATAVASAPVAAGAAAPSASAAPSLTLRKGLLLAEVEALYGAPARTETHLLEGFHLLKATYTRGESTLTAEFVEGVLVRYGVSSN